MSYTGPFADETNAEYKQVLGYKPLLYDDLPKTGENVDSGAALASLDWTTRGAVTPVNDQGQCGSCWGMSRAFSTTGGAGGQWEMTSGSLASFSKQQLVDCSKQNSSRNGGLKDSDFAFLQEEQHCL